MSYVNNVNQFYCNAYNKIGMFSYSPYGWELFSRQDFGDDAWGLFKVLFELPLKVVSTPILLSATVATFLLAAAAAVCTAVLHALTLIGAALGDAFAKSEPKPDPDLEAYSAYNSYSYSY